MAHFNKLQAFQLAENYSILLDKISSVDAKRKILSTKLSKLKEQKEFMEEDLIEYINHHEKPISLKDGRFLHVEKKERRRQRKKSQREIAIKEALKKIEDDGDDLTSEEAHNKILEALSSIPIEVEKLKISDVK